MRMSRRMAMLSGGKRKKKLRYYGELPLGQTYVCGRMANAGEYLVAVGHGRLDATLAVAEAFDENLSMVTAAHIGRDWANSAFVGGCALFAGGNKYNSGAGVSTVSAYDSTLTLKNITSLAKTVQDYMASASTEEHAFFAGGSDDTYGQNNINAYDQALTRTNAPVLSGTKKMFPGCNLGKLAFFAGGVYGRSSYTYYKSVDVYDEVLVKKAADTLSVARYNMLAAHTDGFVIFVGGRTSTGENDYILAEAYDELLTRINAPNLTTYRYDQDNKGSASISGYALFYSGYAGKSGYQVEVYDDTLTVTYFDYSEKICGPAGGGVIGDYALFFNGVRYNSYSPSSPPDDLYRESISVYQVK